MIKLMQSTYSRQWSSCGIAILSLLLACAIITIHAFVPLAATTSSVRVSTTTTTATTTKPTRRYMFTGIVEEMGTVVSLEERDDMTLWDGSKGSGTELTVQGNVVMEGAYQGYVLNFDFIIYLLALCAS